MIFKKEKILYVKDVLEYKFMIHILKHTYEIIVERWKGKMEVINYFNITWQIL